LCFPQSKISALFQLLHFAVFPAGKAINPNAVEPFHQLRECASAKDSRKTNAIVLLAFAFSCPRKGNRLVMKSRSVYNMTMTKGILLVGNDSALLNAVEIETAKRVKRYALASIPNRFSEHRENPASRAAASNASMPKACVPLDWNPGSAVSACTLFLAAENSLGHINEAILVCSPPSLSRAFADLKPLDVEVLVKDHVKSWLFLANEIVSNFQLRKQGVLVFVCPEIGESGAKDTSIDVLGSMAAASFRSLALGLLANATNEPYFTQGFIGGEAGKEAEFANFIFKQLDETNRRTNGKLHKFGKSGFFK